MRNRTPHTNPRGRDAGFTLAELIVASTLMSIVMAGVYTTFSVALRSMRSGDRHYEVYQDARLALGTLAQELTHIAPGSLHLFDGVEDSFEFYTVTQPLNVEEQVSRRMLKVRYRLDRGNLVREEAPVKGPLPAPPISAEDETPRRVELGRKTEFTLIRDVREFSIEYLWAPPLSRKQGQPPPKRVAMLRDDWTEEAFPEGLRISLVVADPREAALGEVVFTTTVALRGKTSPIPARLLKSRNGGGIR